MTATQRKTRAKSEAATATGTTGGIANGRVDSQKVNTQPIVVVAKLDMTESVKQTPQRMWISPRRMQLKSCGLGV